MKKLILVALAAAAFMPAAIISSTACSQASFSTGTPNVNSNCAGLGSAAGFTNLTITIGYGLDVTTNALAPAGSVTVALDSPLAAGDLSGLVVTNATRPLTNLNGVTFGISEADYNANYLNAFVVAVSSSAYTGTASAGNADLVFTLSGDPLQQPIPEPSTMALLGSALVGLGLIARRK
jgi:hypothetical protein